MAVANTFTFGGISTTDYGLVVEGSGDYSAPKRAVDSVEIPGRNGAFQLDKGYYENINVEYKAVAKGATQADFRDSIDAFRNAIVSQIGYQRLEDTYHPGEYRMAMYAGGLEEDPQFHGNGAVFKISFDCKPQRFLTSGEEAVTVTSGGTLTNPTLFEASPLLMVDGYGSLTVNGYDIKLSDETFGAITLATSVESAYVDYKDQVNKFSSGDSLSMTGAVVQFICMVRPTSYSIVNVNVSRTSGSVGFTATSEDIDNRHIRVRLALDDVTYSAKQDTTATSNFRASIHYTNAGGTAGSSNITFTLTVKNTASGVWSAKISNISSDSTCALTSNGGSVDSFVGMSTKSILGEPTYIDCDLGEVYALEDGEIASLNSKVDLGSDLPVLAVGDNAVTFDNTITELKVKPNWWKI